MTLPATGAGRLSICPNKKEVIVMRFEEILRGVVGIEGCGIVPVVYTLSPDRTQVLPVGKLKTFLVLQYHLDHLPAVEDAILIVPKPIAERVRNIYKRRFGLTPKIVEHVNYLETYHYSISKEHKTVKVPSYVMFLEDSVHIPESAELRKLVNEFSDYEFGTVCRVPRTDTLERPFRPEELPRNWYLVDNKALVRTCERVIPRCVPLLSDGVVVNRQGLLQKLW
jgi:hypothetical protein